MKKTVNFKKMKQESHERNVSHSLKKFMNLPYKIELVPLSGADGGGYLASIPLLKGCQSDGQTPDEAMKNLREAQEAWLISALKHGDTIPVPQS